MTEGLRRHLPTIIAVSLIGIGTCAFVLARVYGAAGSMTVASFDNFIFLVPCAAMLACSLVIALTAAEISRELYLAVLGICLAAGVVSMVVTSAWLSQPELVAALLANSGADAQVIPPVRSPLIVLRDIAAFVVAPTVGCIAGAWIGSRLHPVKASGKGKGKGKGKRK